MNERRALGFGLSAVLLWSTVATAFKLTLAELTPIQMLTIASLVSALALTAVCAIQLFFSQKCSRSFNFIFGATIQPIQCFCCCALNWKTTRNFMLI